MPTESRFPSTNAQGRLSGLYPPVRNDKTLLIGIRHRSANRHIHPVQTPAIPNRTTHKLLVIPNRTYQNLLSFRRVSEAKEGGICCCCLSPNRRQAGGRRNLRSTPGTKVAWHFLPTSVKRNPTVRGSRLRPWPLLFIECSTHPYKKNSLSFRTGPQAR